VYDTEGVKEGTNLGSDDFSGLHQAIKQLFPLTDHQLCLVHLQRNARKKTCQKTMLKYLTKNLQR